MSNVYYTTIQIVIENTSTKTLTLNNLSNVSNGWEAFAGGVTSNVTIAPNQSVSVVDFQLNLSVPGSYSAQLGYNIDENTLLNISYAVPGVNTPTCTAGPSVGTKYMAQTTMSSTSSTTGDSPNATIVSTYTFTIQFAATPS